MKKAVIIGVVGIVGVFLIMGVYLVGTYNSFINQEADIVATHEDMQNVHASILKSIKSQGLVAEKYGDMVIKALDVGMSKRYGPDGAKGAMLWIKEQNPTIDPKILEKLQVAIEAGYTRFEAVQRTKIDQLRIYDRSIGSFPRGLVARTLFGFPKRVTADMRTTITSAETKEMMKTKELETIDPFAR